jgi:hypothetical protein
LTGTADDFFMETNPPFSGQRQLKLALPPDCPISLNQIAACTKQGLQGKRRNVGLTLTRMDLDFASLKILAECIGPSEDDGSPNLVTTSDCRVAEPSGYYLTTYERWDYPIFPDVSDMEWPDFMKYAQEETKLIEESW